MKHLSREGNVEDYDEAIRLDPNYAAAYLARGESHFDQGRWSEATSYFSEAIRLDSNDPAAYIKRAIGHVIRGAFDNAIDDLDQSLRLAPANADAFYLRGLAHQKKREDGRAVDDYEQAVRLAPDHARAHGHLAHLLASSQQADVRDGRKAVEHATRACELTALKDVVWLAELAAAQAECGNFAEAVRWQQMALDLSDQKDEALRTRLKLYESGKPFRDE